MGYANLAAEQMLGYRVGGLLGRPLIEVEQSLAMDRWLALWKRARSGGEEPLSFETRRLRVDGSHLPPMYR